MPQIFTFCREYNRSCFHLSFLLFLTLSWAHCTNSSSDCNQGKCQHVWEPHCSLSSSPLINRVLKFAKTVWLNASWLLKKVILNQGCSWLALWLKVLPKFSFLVTSGLSLFFSPCFLCKQTCSPACAYTLSHARALSHSSSLDVPGPCEWIFPFWPHVSNQARNNTTAPYPRRTMPHCHVSDPTLCKLPVVAAKRKQLLSQSSLWINFTSVTWLMAGILLKQHTSVMFNLFLLELSCLSLHLDIWSVGTASLHTDGAAKEAWISSSSESRSVVWGLSPLVRSSSTLILVEQASKKLACFNMTKQPQHHCLLFSPFAFQSGFFAACVWTQSSIYSLLVM